LPANYGNSVFEDGSLHFRCPMGYLDDYNVNTICALGKGVEASIEPDKNGNSCSFWLYVNIPADLVREPTALETAVVKLNSCQFTAEEHAAIAESDLFVKQPS